jgi:threonine dehydrogenase-like Zn-dependent dehydrogenase
VRLLFSFFLPYVIILYFNNKDISQPRLDFAKKIGATYVVLASNDSQTTAKQVVETLGAMPNISIECSGAESSIQTTFFVSNS